MKCIDCPNSRFVNDENGVVDLICFKLNKPVIATTVCLDSKRSKEEERVKKIYLDNFQRYPLRDIAKMIGWSMNKLNWFIYINFLPRIHIRKRKNIK
jgi:hypothetical protein